ncbi:MAG: replication factor C small subunit [Candidatus Lokiarchaeota archaeon]|nr:replication factor C small subunit [Candidatus Lokiarchaeota archaeon]MBD3339238.1 replication factor C small subunit [Candidatus Lokiarchaeota archaeon]
MSLDNRPWVEKYRPRSLDDVVNQKEIIQRLKKFIEDRSMPHLIFAGPAGTGKTTSALAMVRDLYGRKMEVNNTYLELNASDARGIDVIRTYIKDFAKARPPVDIAFKILILDEADNMTAPAQQALRRTMEKYTKNCRMILICNYSNKIIPPIQSRCVVFRFAPLSNDDIKERVKMVAEREEISLEPNGLTALVEVSRGDCRRAINYLQSCGTISKKIDQEIIFRVAGEVPPDKIKNILNTAIEGELQLSVKLLKDLVKEYGLSGRNIIKNLHREIYDLNVSETQKIKLSKLLAEYEYRLSQGGTEEIQLQALLANIVLLKGFK